jgi:hypothetical protein
MKLTHIAMILLLVNSLSKILKRKRGGDQVCKYFKIGKTSEVKLL